jgi:hypothetical protein
MPDYSRKVAYPPISPTNALVVSIGAAHTESSAIQADAVRLAASAPCYIAFGSNPIATSSSMYLPGAAEIFAFNAGDKVSVLQASSAGVLSISWGD